MDNKHQDAANGTSGGSGNSVSVVPSAATLTPVQVVQANVTKYATALFDKERAVEFSTRVALMARDNPKILDALRKNPDAFLSAYMASVSLNLMPNTPAQEAHIIPYGDKVQFQTGYKGLLKLARRSGEIKMISAELVFDGDQFHAEFGTNRHIEHIPNFDIDRTDYSKVTHAYAAALLTNGETVFTVMSKTELDKVQSTVKAQSTDTPWKQWPERMARKTVLKRLTTDLPSSAEDLQRAATLDSMSEAGKLAYKDGEFLDGELVPRDDTTASAADKARAKLAKAGIVTPPANTRKH